jgi:hypothetical protein
MNVDIFKPEQWHDFFLMVGGGAAALAGLVFVGMTINLKIIICDPTHKNRAIGTLTGFTAVFMICALGLVGKQNHQSIGIEWLAVSVPATIIYIRGYFQAIKMHGSPLALSISRLIFGTADYAVQIIGSFLLIAGHIAGLYLASIAMVISFASLISGAWLLIVGIHESQVDG